jgi:hypothetical protein
VILNHRNDFFFFDIDNLCKKEKICYDIENFIGYTAYENKHHFFKTNGVYTVNFKGHGKFLPIRLNDNCFKKKRSPFYSKDNLMCENPNIKKYDYFENDLDVKSELFDEIMFEIEREKFIENEKILPTPVFSQVKKKQNKNSGF